MSDYLFEKRVEDYDPNVKSLVDFETERQARRLIMIPSESIAPKAVRDLLASPFTNIYAEGYPRPETRYQDEATIMDYAYQLGRYRRHSDGRYYKGVEYVDMVEALARRRAAELFAANNLIPDDLWVNVQPLSGAPANTAVYTALIETGDAILGMDLLHGGHLTHGSPVNRSGMVYNAYHYTVDPKTERLDYDEILKLAKEAKPKIIIAGYTSYPWIPDWQKFREIADEVGAWLLADISHIAGMVAARKVPSPIGIADVVSFTTHKTLCGPRGAVVICHDRELGEKIDKGIFPGEQGGPHVNTIAAMALTFKLATTNQFVELQEQTLKNAKALSDAFKELGVRVSYGGTDSHMCLIDCKSYKSPAGVPLNGDLGARILDLAGIVVNRNTIPGDKSALRSTGIRMGSTWLTQRGFKENDFKQIAGLIDGLFKATTPYYMIGRSGNKTRAKLDFETLIRINSEVRTMADAKPGIDEIDQFHGFPHYFYLEDHPRSGYGALEMTGETVRSFLNFTMTSDVEALQPGDSQNTMMHTTSGDIHGVLTCKSPYRYILTVPAENLGLAGLWIVGLSTGFIYYDEDLTQRIPGPISINRADPVWIQPDGDPIDSYKPYFVGMPKDVALEARPDFVWTEPVDPPLKRTPLYDTHVALGAKMTPFAGWEMPLWYTSVLQEHLATRQAAGLFDVTHMGVFLAEGPDAAVFLDSVCGNDVLFRNIGESVYTHFMDPDANVIDDLIIYRIAKEKYLLVVNAANEDKDWAWLNAVKNGEVLVDRERPWVTIFGRNVILRNLKDPKEGKDMLVDIALQGQVSREILCELADPAEQRKIRRLNRNQLCQTVLDGMDAIVSRTGYTGEKMSFEIFVHPDNAVRLWNAIMEVGTPLGLLPNGLGARDSLRTEAGLPLYGHEMGGDMNLTIGEAGFLPFLKLNSAWFIGREAFVQREAERTGVVARFTFDEKAVRMAHHGDPVCDLKGRMIGKVTSCAIDSNGYLTGQAFVDKKAAAVGTKIFIFQNAPNWRQNPPAQLTPGDRVALPGTATIVSRYMP
ncbi:MAG: serine hydroxymethyltransferase [Anaerolineaceae bacterium]|jgi:glycine hydroxymethyltransferase|nr:serine hydroxymethyltransferase [Anaerolineaceae bacterium]